MFSMNSDNMFIRGTFPTSRNKSFASLDQVNGACYMLLITCCPGTGSSSVPKMDLPAACKTKVYETKCSQENRVLHSMEYLGTRHNLISSQKLSLKVGVRIIKGSKLSGSIR